MHAPLYPALLSAADKNFPNNGPGRGGPWWNDPTYWIGLLLGVSLAYPLINRFILNKTSDKEKVSTLSLDTPMQTGQGPASVAYAQRPSQIGQAAFGPPVHPTVHNACMRAAVSSEHRMTNA